MRGRLGALWDRGLLLLAALRRAVMKRWYALMLELVKHWAVLGTAALGLGGWSLLTHLLAGWAGGWVCELSAGLLALSLFGWRFAYVIARDGLYTLSRKPGPK